MKIPCITFIFILLVSSSVFGKDLRNISKPISIDLTGPVGFDGVDGQRGIDLDCSQFEMPIEGNSGEDGRDGEMGGEGEDLFVYLDNTDLLKLLTLDQSGGKGGKGGAGGLGSNGCNGGMRGETGLDGVNGSKGPMGRFFLLPKNFTIPKVNNTKILSLTQLDEESITLSENTWEENPDLLSLLDEGSKVRSKYYTFSGTKSYEVKLVWNSAQFLTDVEDTKFALSLSGGKLDLKSYTGGFLEYTILKKSYGFDVIILKVIAEHRVQNLRLKRIKYSGIDLTLEVRQKFDPNVSVKTRFVISFERIEGREVKERTGFIEISENLVVKNDDRYFITIGRLRIPESFKKKEAKLRILLTVYREVKGQTRARGLDGIFKI